MSILYGLHHNNHKFTAHLKFSCIFIIVTLRNNNNDNHNDNDNCIPFYHYKTKERNG